LVMIAWQLSNMLAVKTAGGVSDSVIASKLSLNPYAVGRTKSAVRGIDQSQLIKMADKVRKADIKTKTTSVDVVQVIKKLIAEL
jgi:DNA polymerase III delta subunit